MFKVEKAPRSRYPDKLSSLVRISADLRARLDTTLQQQPGLTESDIVRAALDKYLPKKKAKQEG
jgi:hypothetical protein